MAKKYITSGTPQVSSMKGTFAERGSNSRRDVRVMQDAMRSDRIRKSRSNGQRVRQARERLYGKQSHRVAVSYLPGRDPLESLVAGLVSE